MSNFEWAVKNGDIHAVKTAVSADKSLVNETLPSSKRSALCVAADFGQTDVILYLLENGAEINKADKYGITPLLSAIFEGHVPAVKLLLSKGADKNGKSPDGQSYFDCAETEEIKQLLK